MKIVRVSDPILLPLAPTIAGTIANYLQLMAQQVHLRLLQLCNNTATELPPDWDWDWQSERAIQIVTTTQYQYVSTIAHRLAAKSSLNTLKICENLQPPVLNEMPTKHSGLELACWYNDSGYIYFQVTDIAIDRWLEYIHYIPIKPELHAESTVPVPNVAIYTHARCCSLLKLAEREKLIILNPDWQISTVDRSESSYPVAERDCPENRSPEQLTSIYDRAAERQLIQTLMAVLDAIYSNNSSEVCRRRHNWAKLTIDLAQSWLEFYRYCQILGEPKRQSPHLAIARCRLTAIARRYLQVLLENYLGVSVLWEL